MTAPQRWKIFENKPNSPNWRQMCPWLGKNVGEQSTSLLGSRAGAAPYFFLPLRFMRIVPWVPWYPGYAHC